jgi:hypothetical protein
MHISNINTPLLPLQVEGNLLCQTTLLIEAFGFSNAILVIIIRFFYDSALFSEDKVGPLEDL